MGDLASLSPGVKEAVVSRVGRLFANPVVVTDSLRACTVSVC